MTAHDWYLENRILFATRILAKDEELLFRNHLSRCEECRAAVAELEQELAWLPMGIAPEAPRPGLTRYLLERVRQQRRIRWRRWVAALATAASLVLAARVWTDARREIRGLRGALNARQERLMAIEDSLAAIVGAERVLQKTIRGSGYEGGFLLFYDQDTQRWNIVVHDLPRARTGEAYQLWFVTGRGLLPGPEVHVDGARPTFLALPAPGPSGAVVGAVLAIGPLEQPSGRLRGVELARLTF